MSEPVAEPGRPEATLDAVAHASLRLMAGSVSARTLGQLRRTLEASPAEYPWQVATQAILAEPVDPQRLVQQGLAAQRDWILRGGREKPGPTIGRRAKGLLARLCAQLVFGVLYAVVIVAILVLLKHRYDGVDIYRVLDWVRPLMGR